MNIAPAASAAPSGGQPGAGFPVRFLALSDVFQAGSALPLSGAFHFVWVAAGSAPLTVVGEAGGSGVEATLRAGDLLLLTPRFSVELSAAGERVAAYLFSMAPDYFDSLPEGMALYARLVVGDGGGELPLFRRPRAAGDDLLHIARLLPMAAAAELHRESMERHLCSLFLLKVSELLVRAGRTAAPAALRPAALFRDFRKLLALHFKAHHDLAFYAARLGISTTYLSRVVRKTTGRTVHDTIAELLEAEARRLLEDTGMAVKEIAHELHFADQSAFGRFFLRRAGLPPQQFRLRSRQPGCRS